MYEDPTPTADPLPVKSVFAADLSLGDEVAELFILAAAQQGQAKNGPYWRLEFRDVSGGISGKLWSPHSQAYPELTAGMAVRVRGRVISYRDKLELAVDGLRILNEGEAAALDLTRFIPTSRRKPEEMLEELLDLARKTLLHRPLRKLVVSLLTDTEIVPLLRLAPAAKNMHHAYAGGLLEHTLSVARLCLNMAAHYPYLDSQLLFAGAVCHDLGKIWELHSGLVIDYTTPGRLRGHISLLLEKIVPFIKKSALEPELAEHLQHLVLSHHGTYEFGSPRLPSTAEALVLHYADNIDAKVRQVETALAAVEEGGWSAYSTALERFLYQPMRTPQAPEQSGRAGRQQSGDAVQPSSLSLSLFD